MVRGFVWPPRILLLAGVSAWLALALPVGAQVSQLDPDEEIVLFPSLAQRTSRDRWEIEVQGCVFEPEKRRFTLAMLHELLEMKGAELSAAQREVLTARSRLFMVDHERGKRVVVEIAGQRFEMPKSQPDGRFSRRVSVPAGLLPKGTSRATMRAVLAREDPRTFSTEIVLGEDTGVVVVSDIDDTIKVTGVGDRDALLRNTFLEPFRPVPGMPELYQRWATRPETVFCYVSASPWQLFAPLAEFVGSNGFPQGTFYLKDVRWKDESLLNLFQKPEEYKPPVIEKILKQFPRRQFVLVGDAGEKDPEIYAALARKYPGQVSRIFIRDTTAGAMNLPRCRALASHLPAGVMCVFTSPTDIRGLNL